MSSKKIVFIGTTGASFYGFRAEIIQALVSQGHNVYAFTSEYTATCLEKIRNLGATPITYRLNRGGLNPIADIIATYQLTHKIKKIQPEIVFSFFVKPIIYGTLAARMANAPRKIGMLEGLGYTFTEQPQGLNTKIKLIQQIQVLLYKMALPSLDDIVFLNPDDQKDLLDVHQIRVRRSHILGGIGLNLVDYPYTQAVTHPINFLFIGRLLKEKGIFEFITAARLVKTRYPNVTFTVLGAIDFQNMGALTQEQLNELIAENLFEYPGHVSNVKDWIAKSSVFVLPSYREGVPRSTQEAMAIGRPVITTDVPGCRETVINGVNGFLVPKWNPKALAEKMIYFIENPEQINIMGRESHKIAVERFDADKVNQKLLNIMGLD